MAGHPPRLHRLTDNIIETFDIFNGFLSFSFALSSPRIEEPDQGRKMKRNRQIQQAKKGKARLDSHVVRLLFIFFLASCGFLILRFVDIEPSPAFPSTIFFPGNLAEKNSIKRASPRCSSVPKNSICCGRNISEVCVLRGDIRSIPSSSSIFLFNGRNGSAIPPNVKRINDLELKLVVLNRADDSRHKCDVTHRVPAVVFSSGGLRDCIIPLYITSRRFNRRVVFLVADFRTSWRAKYRDILSRLSAYPIVDFSGDNRIRCFPEMTVGLRDHRNLSNQIIFGFRRLLDDAYRPRIHYLNRQEKEKELSDLSTPKLAIILGSKTIENDQELIELCQEMGFKVETLRHEAATELAEIYRVLNSTDVALDISMRFTLTHLLFTRQGGVFIQTLSKEDNYVDVAKEIGLDFMTYEITSMTNKRVKLDLNSLLRRLTRAFQSVVQRKIEESNSSLNWNQNWTSRRRDSDDD